MAFSASHFDELQRQGYTVVTGDIPPALLRAAQATAEHLSAIWPDGNWERSKNETWREVRDCQHSDFVAIVESVLDPLAGEILESVNRPERIQLAATLPGFSTKGIVGRHFHIDGGTKPSLACFNFLFGVALTDVQSHTAGGFHVLPGSHRDFARHFASELDKPTIDWGEVKIAGQKKFLSAEMTVPHLKAGDIIVMHSFLAHGTSANTTDVRRDMLFQRRAALPLCSRDPVALQAARDAFMRDPWLYFRRH